MAARSSTPRMTAASMRPDVLVDTWDCRAACRPVADRPQPTSPVWKPVLRRKRARKHAEAAIDRPAHDLAMAEDHQARLCRLGQSVGRVEICPEQACPFWNSGVEGRQGHCAFDGVDLNGRDDLLRWLLELRAELDRQGDVERDELRSRFYRRLNDGRAD